MMMRRMMGMGIQQETDGEEDMEEDEDKSERTSQSKEITTSNVEKGKIKTRKKDTNDNETKEPSRKRSCRNGEWERQRKREEIRQTEN